MIDLIQKSSAHDPDFSGNPWAGPVGPDYVAGISWGLTAPTPPRRIREGETALAQRGPDEAPERLRAKARRGRNRDGIFQMIMRSGKIGAGL